MSTGGLPNASWWLYKWYGDMSGEMVSTVPPAQTGIDGAAAVNRFSLEEARALFEAAGMVLSGSAVKLLHARTEGWAAGLRLAALAVAGHPDPERFAGEFSGSERTVADYLLAEVLDRQPEEVRRLLLRTSVLEQVNGKLADPQPPLEPLSGSETRVLRYLPTNLTAPEIAGQLHLSVHTVKMHMRHLYAKLGTHRRAEAVERARALGLLAPSLRKP